MVYCHPFLSYVTHASSCPWDRIAVGAPVVWEEMIDVKTWLCSVLLEANNTKNLSFLPSCPSHQTVHYGHFLPSLTMHSLHTRTQGCATYNFSLRENNMFRKWQIAQHEKVYCNHIILCRSFKFGCRLIWEIQQKNSDPFLRTHAHHFSHKEILQHFVCVGGGGMTSHQQPCCACPR